MSLLSRVLGQCRQPTGWSGRLLARGMNRAHAPMTAWALSHIGERDVRRVLDIGCGGGATLVRLADLYPAAVIHGVDVSRDALRVAAGTTRKLIEEDRVVVREASVSSIPWVDASFDLVVAVESIYFWPDLAGDLGEIRRVLRPGGLLMLAGGLYLGGRFDRRNRKLARAGGVRCLTLAELGERLDGAGLFDVAIQEERRRGWFCVVGRMPDEVEDPTGCRSPDRDT